MSGGGGSEIKDSELNKELAEIGKEKWEHYNEFFVPEENKWIEFQAQQNQEKYYERKGGEANVAAQKAMGEQQAAMLEQGGNTARLSAGINRGAEKQQSLTSDMTGRMQADQQKRYLGGLSNVGAVGQGKEAKALSAGSTSAEYANRYAASQAQKQDDTLGELVGMGIGAGTRYGLG